jgi:hypothetical protein
MHKGKTPNDIVILAKQPAQLLQRDEDGGVREVGTVAHKGPPLPHVTTNFKVIYTSRNTLSANTASHVTLKKKIATLSERPVVSVAGTALPRGKREGTGRRRRRVGRGGAEAVIAEYDHELW